MHGDPNEDKLEQDNPHEEDPPVKIEHIPDEPEP